MPWGTKKWAGLSCEKDNSPFLVCNLVDNMIVCVLWQHSITVICSVAWNTPVILLLSVQHFLLLFRLVLE